MFMHTRFCISENRRGFLVRLCCGLASLIGFSQQTPLAVPNVLTPKQKAFRQQRRDVDTKRESLRTQAKQVFEAEIARQKAGDCPDAKTTYEINICYSKEVGITDQNLKSYELAIRSLLGLKDPDITGQPPMRGPAGPRLTPEESVSEFDRMEQLWQSYLEAAATAAFHRFGGGTGGPGFQMSTHIQLVRGHLTELNNIYYGLLHL